MLLSHALLVTRAVAADPGLLLLLLRLRRRLHLRWVHAVRGCAPRPRCLPLHLRLCLCLRLRLRLRLRARHSGLLLLLRQRRGLRRRVLLLLLVLHVLLLLLLRAHRLRRVRARVAAAARPVLRVLRLILRLLRVRAVVAAMPAIRVRLHRSGGGRGRDATAGGREVARLGQLLLLAQRLLALYDLLIQLRPILRDCPLHRYPSLSGVRTESSVRVKRHFVKAVTSHCTQRRSHMQRNPV